MRRPQAIGRGRSGPDRCPPRVSRRHGQAETGRSFRNRRRTDRRNQHSLLVEPSRQTSGPLVAADNQRENRRASRESSGSQALQSLQALRHPPPVFPKAVPSLRLPVDEGERLDRHSRRDGRNGRRKNERSGPVPEELDQPAAARHIRPPRTRAPSRASPPERPRSRSSRSLPPLPGPSVPEHPWHGPRRRLRKPRAGSPAPRSPKGAASPSMLKTVSVTIHRFFPASRLRRVSR